MVSSNDGVFSNITNTFSTTDIRTVYSFEKMIGGGHFGTVRTAHLKSDPETKYAIKSILRENIEKDIKLLEEELFILAKVDHPNIVKFHQSFIDYRYVHIVMEFCNGGELFDRIVAAQKFDERVSADIMSQMLQGIKHLHEHNIVHRDLKPENYLMETKDKNSEIKLIDFGLSKRWSTDDGAAKMHTVVGTPYYVAPEVLRGEYDKMCDVWSLGIILYVFLCGYPPFEGDNNKEIFKNVLKSKLEFDPADWDTVSKEAKDLVSKMLNKDPKKRLSAEDCLSHEWFQINHTEHTSSLDKQQLIRRMQRFRLPKKLQMEAMRFLVNQKSTEGLDFAQLRNAFRDLDTDKSGTLQLSEIKEAFKNQNLSEDQLNDIFEKIDLNNDGEIEYSEFLTVTIDKQQAFTKANLDFAFHHFDVNNSGYITSDNLIECFKREGKHLTEDEINEILEEIKTEKPGQVSYEEFIQFMMELKDDGSPSKLKRLGST